MNIGLSFLEQIRALPGGVWIVQQIEELMSAIAAGWGQEHSPDGTHVWIKQGTGSPEGVVSAPIGTLYLRKDGSTSTTLYVKTSGSQRVGWTAK